MNSEKSNPLSPEQRRAFDILIMKLKSGAASLNEQYTIQEIAALSLLTRDELWTSNPHDRHEAVKALHRLIRANSLMLGIECFTDIMEKSNRSDLTPRISAILLGIFDSADKAQKEARDKLTPILENLPSVVENPKVQL